MKDPKNTFLTLTLLLVASLTVMSGATIAASLPQIQQVFADNAHAGLLIKLVLTMPALFIALGAPFAGMIVDRYGRIKPLMAGLALYAVAGSSGLYVQSLEALLVGRAFLGLAVALILTVMTTLAADYFSGEARNRYLGLQGMAISGGGVLYIALGGLCADIHWRTPFALYLFAVIVLLLSLKFLFEPKRHDGSQGEAEPAGKKLLPVYVVGFSGMVVFYMIPVQFPFLLTQMFSSDATTIGTTIATAMLTGAIASSQYVKLRKRLSVYQVYVLLLFFYGVGYIGIGVAARYETLLFFAAVSGLGVGWFLVNSITWLLERAHASRRGKASGMMGAMIFLGQFFSPIAVEPIAAVTGLQSTFFAVGAVMLLLCGVLFLKERAMDRRKG